MLLVVGVDVTGISVFTGDSSLLRAAGRRHHATVLVSAIVLDYWLHIDSQIVHEGLLTAARSLEAFRHLEIIYCPNIVSSGNSKMVPFVVNMAAGLITFKHRPSTSMTSVSRAESSSWCLMIVIERCGYCVLASCPKTKNGICYRCYLARTCRGTFSRVRQSV